MKEELIFGPSGKEKEGTLVDSKFTTINMPKVLTQHKLKAYEYSMTYGVNLSDEKAEEFGREFKKYGIHLSVHGPYYINLASEDEKIVASSFGYFSKCLKKMKLLGADRFVFHPGWLSNRKREDVFKTVKERFKTLIERLEKEGLLSDDVYLCPETTGKTSASGSLDEIIELCKLHKNVIPTIDFGHLNSITQGSLNSVDAFRTVISYIFNQLGAEKASKMHIHFSRIVFGEKGEKWHINFKDEEEFGPYFEHLAPILKEFGVVGRVICESKHEQMKDAITMQKLYNQQ